MTALRTFDGKKKRNGDTFSTQKVDNTKKPSLQKLINTSVSWEPKKNMCD